MKCFTYACWFSRIAAKDVKGLDNARRWKRTRQDANKFSQPDIEFADANVTSIYTKFQHPRTEAGVNYSVVELINEWHDLIEYALEYLSAQSTHYLKTFSTHL